MDYDLIIAGAGPTGLMAAKTAAERALKVRKLENCYGCCRNTEDGIGFPYYKGRRTHARTGAHGKSDDGECYNNANKNYRRRGDARAIVFFCVHVTELLYRIVPSFTTKKNLSA